MGRSANRSAKPSSCDTVLDGRQIHKKGGRPKAAFKSREETPKEGMCGAIGTAPQQDTLHGLKCKNFHLGVRANVYKKI